MTRKKFLATIGTAAGIAGALLWRGRKTKPRKSPHMLVNLSPNLEQRTREVIQNNLQLGVNKFFRSDQSLHGRLAEKTLYIEIVPSINQIIEANPSMSKAAKLIKKFGINGLTCIGQLPNGERRIIIYFSEKSLKNPGAALSVISHEFYNAAHIEEFDKKHGGDSKKALEMERDGYEYTIKMLESYIRKAQSASDFAANTNNQMFVDALLSELADRRQNLMEIKGMLKP